MKRLADERGVALLLEVIVTAAVLVVATGATYTYLRLKHTAANPIPPAPPARQAQSPSPSPTRHTPAEALSRVEALYGSYIKASNGATGQSAASLYGPYFTSQLSAKLFATPTPAAGTAGGGSAVMCGAENMPTKVTYTLSTVTGTSAIVTVYEYVATSSPSAHFEVTVSLTTLLVTALSCIH